MRRGFLILSVVITLAFGINWLFRASAQQKVSTITFNEVAPILYQHCASCHRAGEIAPMSLLTYKESRPWARSIREQVSTRQMPPFHADATYGPYANDVRLSQREIETLVAWVAQGASEGDPKKLPASPQFKDGWKYGEPDVVLPLPKDEVIGADGEDEYRYIDVPTGFTEDKWVQVAEVMPGNRKVVHHATVMIVTPEEMKNDYINQSHNRASSFVVSSGKLRHVRPDLPVLNDGCSSPDGGAFPGTKPTEGPQIGVYLPGKGPDIRPHGYAVKVPAGSYLKFQMHYSKQTGKVEKDRTSIGLTFAKVPVTHQVKRIEIWNKMFAIPPHADNHRVTSCYTFDKDVDAVSFTAHMHYRGKAMKAEAFYPDGKREVLFDVPQYSFNWQTTYRLQNARRIPKGTRIFTTAYFDNSSKNKFNPDPTKTIRHGEPSDEEMMGLWIEYIEPGAQIAPLPKTARRQ